MQSKLTETLLVFVDFIYAVVFGLLVQKTFERILVVPLTGHKLIQLLFILVTFYLLAWDWLLGRILTLRNPYQSYTRFFFEIIIAALAYGTANAAADENTCFFLLLGLFYITGAFWAHQTARQIKKAHDIQELCVIKSTQTWTGIMSIVIFSYLSPTSLRQLTSAQELSGTVFISGLIIFYELLTPRVRGLAGGPGVPFVPRASINKVRRLMKKYMLNLHKIELWLYNHFMKWC